MECLDAISKVSALNDPRRAHGETVKWGDTEKIEQVMTYEGNEIN